MQTPPPIPNNITPPPIPMMEEPASVDPRFSGIAANPDDIAQGIIDAEISKYTSEDLKNISTTPIEKKKNMIIGISAAISLICIVLSQFFHWGLCLTAIVVIVNLIACKIFSSNMDLRHNLLNEAKSRPDESIENIVANASVEFCKRKSLLRKGAYIGIVVLLPMGMFSKTHIFYETAPDGKYVRYYIDGIFDRETTVEIPETVDGITVKGIRGDAFMESQVKYVILPNTIDTIRGHAFQGCENLERINLPKSLKYIGGYAFAQCKKLQDIEFPESLTLISGHAFEDCESLTFSKLPASLDSIGGYAFCNCQRIESVEIPENVKRLGGGAFKNCGSLRYVKLSPNIIEIRGETFEDCSRLKSIEIPEGIKRIGGSAFKNCKWLSEVKLPSTIRNIGSSAFRNCPELKEIEITNSCKDIDLDAFRKSPTRVIRTE